MSPSVLGLVIVLAFAAGMVAGAVWPSNKEDKS